MKRAALPVALRRLRAAARALGVVDYDVESIADGSMRVAPAYYRVPGLPGVFDRLLHAAMVQDLLTAASRTRKRAAIAKARP